MTEIKFNPCPLCGKPVFYPADESVFYKCLSKSGRSSLFVECSTCKLQVAVYTYDYPYSRDYGFFLRILAEKWNRLSAVK